MLFLKTWRFLSLLTTTLTTGLSFAHTLELPTKMEYGTALYLTLQKTLYSGFETIGLFVEVGAIAATILVCWLVRHHRSALPLTLFTAVCLLLALTTWLLFVAPAHAEMMHWTAAAFPENWSQWQSQWEYAHACRFFIHLVGLSSLLCSILAELPSDRSAASLPTPIPPVRTKTLEVKLENNPKL